MKRIIIGFSRPKGWKAFAESIMLADKLLYHPKNRISHAYTRFESLRWNCSFIYHSAGHAINFMGDVHFNSINEVVEEYELYVSDETEQKIGAMCIAREGLKYPIIQQIGKGIVALAFLLFKKKIKNPFPSPLDDCMEEQAQLISKALNVEVNLDLNSLTIEPYRSFIESLPTVKRIK